MKTFRLSLILIAVGALLVGGLPLTAQSTSVSIATPDKDLSAATLKELARVRAATARYHNLARAQANGYINLNIFETGEGFHYEKGSLVDDVIDLEQPEDLIYAAVPPGDGLKLVAVEYLIPLDCNQPFGEPPAGFTGDADVWESGNEDGFCFWKLTVWVWMHNPNGMFASTNPDVP